MQETICTAGMLRMQPMIVSVLSYISHYKSFTTLFPCSAQTLLLCFCPSASNHRWELR